jgi:hypothetical protein
MQPFNTVLNANTFYRSLALSSWTTLLVPAVSFVIARTIVEVLVSLGENLRIFSDVLD